MTLVGHQTLDNELAPFYLKNSQKWCPTLIWPWCS